MTAPIVLETPRLLLRPHRLDDFEVMAALWADARVAQFIGGKPSTAEESWSRLIRYIGFWPALGFGYFAITDKETGAFLGEAGLADFHRDITPSLEGFAEAGWALMPDAWGNGYAQEALSALLAWYANEPSPRPAACIISTDNAASIRLAEKTGFRLKAETQYKDSACLMFER